MPKWLTHRIDLVAVAAIGFAFLTIAATIGFAYMEIQSQNLVERVTMTETHLADANAKAESLEAELANLKAELAEKVRRVVEQSARVATSVQAQSSENGGGQLWQQYDEGYRWSRRPSVPALVENRSTVVNQRQTFVEAKLTN